VTATGKPGDDTDATVYAPPASRKAFQRSALQSDATVRSAEGRAIDLGAVSGVNPIAAAANQLLCIVPQLRASVSHPDQNALRDQLLRQIVAFEKAARDRGISGEQVLVARYALCTLLDESISLTPWGGGGQWARFSLLVTLYKETSGGEKFFLLLGKMAEDPAKNLFLLELMYICLALGFEGRYRVISTGKGQLEEVRERLYNMIRKQRGESERDLSAHWRGLLTTTVRTVRFLPLWATAAVAALSLAGVFIGFSLALNQRSDNVFGMLAKLRVPTVRTTVVAKPVPPRLSGFLADEINKRLVEVSEDESASRVSILGDGLFEPGSAVIEKPYAPVVARVTEALNKVPGQVIVTGHTDDRPIRSVRFPSNWHLSQERAVSVVRLMSKTIDNPTRLKADGLADTFPVAPNDTPANRARNRRVEIILKVSQ
jgi:type VI secretion system protein ImpK